MSKQILFLATIAMIAMAATTGCGGNAGANAGTPLNVTVTATEFKFEPMTITAAPGQTVALTLKNTGSVQHTWLVAAANVKVTADPGKSATATFVAPAKAGTYPIDCDVAGHKEAGMVGQLIVK